MLQCLHIFFNRYLILRKFPSIFFFKTNKNFITEIFGINLPNDITTKFLPIIGLIIGGNLVVKSFRKLIVGLNKQRARR